MKKNVKSMKKKHERNVKKRKIYEKTQKQCEKNTKSMKNTKNNVKKRKIGEKTKPTPHIPSKP